MISYFTQKCKFQQQEEDSLVSVVFDRLKYLPSEIFWKIIKRALSHDKLPHSCGEIRAFSFWEKWDSTDTVNKNFVEPDIYLECTDFDIIIEAKSTDEKQQVDNQRTSEIIAYFNEYDAKNKKLFYLMVGGLWNFDDEEDFYYQDNAVKICKTNWSALLESIIKEKSQMEQYNYSQTNAMARILDDTIKGFELYQFYKRKWLKELTDYSIDTIKFNL